MSTYSRFFSNLSSNQYGPLWSKYRPAILQLMVAAMEEKPGTYQLSGHEFKSIEPKKTNFQFTLLAFKGKASNNIKSISIAHDLLAVLDSSKRAKELMEAHAYEFRMDKTFALHIVRHAPPVEASQMAAATSAMKP